MPQVGNVSFPYDPAGTAAAHIYAAISGLPMVEDQGGGGMPPGGDMGMPPGMPPGMPGAPGGGPGMPPPGLPMPADAGMPPGPPSAGAGAMLGGPGGAQMPADMGMPPPPPVAGGNMPIASAPPVVQHKSPTKKKSSPVSKAKKSGASLRG